MNYIDFYKDLKEDYPPGWDIEKFKTLKSFSQRVKYCNEHLQKMSQGSSRIVYKIDEEKVLKLAKNKKGIAQNEVESDGFLLRSYADIIAKVFNVDENRLWLEMELAKKLTPSRFKALTGFSIKSLNDYLLWINFQTHPHPYMKSDYYKERILKPELEVIENSEFVNDITGMIADMDMPVGDLGRLSSYGEVIRDGNPKVVIIDAGLNRRVFQDFYGVN